MCRVCIQNGVSTLPAACLCQHEDMPCKTIGQFRGGVALCLPVRFVTCYEGGVRCGSGGRWYVCMSVRTYECRSDFGRHACCPYHMFYYPCTRVYRSACVGRGGSLDVSYDILANALHYSCMHIHAFAYQSKWLSVCTDSEQRFGWDGRTVGRQELDAMEEKHKTGLVHIYICVHACNRLRVSVPVRLYGSLSPSPSVHHVLTSLCKMCVCVCKCASILSNTHKLINLFFSLFYQPSRPLELVFTDCNGWPRQQHL